MPQRDLNNFQPRVGMAYNFRKNWVFRGGFAVNTLDLWTNGLQENFEEYLATAVVQPPPGDPDVAFYLREGPAAVQLQCAARRDCLRLSARTTRAKCVLLRSEDALAVHHELERRFPVSVRRPCCWS